MEDWFYCDTFDPIDRWIRIHERRLLRKQELERSLHYCFDDCIDYCGDDEECLNKCYKECREKYTTFP